MVDTLTLPRPRRTAPTAVPTRHAPWPAPADNGRESVALSLIAICALVLGTWLPASHYLLDYPFVEGAEDAFFSEALAGVIVACAGYGRLQSPVRLPKLTALQAAAGAWLVAAPWLIGYAEQVPAARANGVVCGLAAIVLAAAAASFSHRQRGLARPAPRARRAPGQLCGDHDLPPQIRVPDGRRPEHAGAD